MVVILALSRPLPASGTSARLARQGDRTSAALPDSAAVLCAAKIEHITNHHRRGMSAERPPWQAFHSPSVCMHGRILNAKIATRIAGQGKVMNNTEHRRGRALLSNQKSQPESRYLD